MPLFRKKPVVIEAIRWDGDTSTFDVLISWDRDQSRTFSMSNQQLYIQTLEGKMQADLGDWIIKGTKGEVYPCKPDIFDEIYEYAIY